MDALSLCEIISVLRIVDILEIQISLVVKPAPLRILHDHVGEFQLLAVQPVRLRLSVNRLVVETVLGIVYKRTLCVCENVREIDRIRRRCRRTVLLQRIDAGCEGKMLRIVKALPDIQGIAKIRAGVDDTRRVDVRIVRYPGGDGVGSDPDPLRRCVLHEGPDHCG